MVLAWRGSYVGCWTDIISVMFACTQGKVQHREREEGGMLIDIIYVEEDGGIRGYPFWRLKLLVVKFKHWLVVRRIYNLQLIIKILQVEEWEIIFSHHLFFLGLWEDVSLRLSATEKMNFLGYSVLFMDWTLCIISLTLCYLFAFFSYIIHRKFQYGWEPVLIPGT